MGILEDIIVLGVIVILPIIPAFILFKWLPPEKTIASGPFKGLNLKFTGSFAGYFVVLLFTSGFFLAYSSQKIEYDLWSVEGYIETEQKQEKSTNTNILISVQPPLQRVDPDGHFTIQDIQVKRGEKMQDPTLLIQKEGYELEVVRLGDKKSPDIISEMQKNHIFITIKDKIKLKRMGERFEYSTEMNAIDAMPIEKE